MKLGSLVRLTPLSQSTFKTAGYDSLHYVGGDDYVNLGNLIKSVGEDVIFIIDMAADRELLFRYGDVVIKNIPMYMFDEVDYLDVL